MIKQDGKYRAKAVDVMLGESGVKGTPYVGVEFKVVEQGESLGETVKWSGWLSEKAGPSGKTVAERTIESLRACGWTGDDLGCFATGLHGLDANEVEIVVEMKPYDGPNDSHKGKSFPEVKWVNSLAGGRGLRKDDAMDAVKAARLGERFRGLALALKPAEQPSNDQLQGTSFPYGANAAGGGKGRAF
ncbi:hypothetical protein [Brasilonema bromeliae]|uniref:Uncharacterized protein n=1 Tax=Brasilonema bromeliae SPC951 TaxID=385972 RepID=A0ABX1PDG8_9CYAN|nr:hypothetical protein [Brasilonema bromeliae]NMG22528.1 hypothetical protein [Brasilonema bromeliae SPC951]